MAKKLTDRQRFNAWWWRQPAGLAYVDGWAAWRAAIRSERRRKVRHISPLTKNWPKFLHDTEYTLDANGDYTRKAPLGRRGKR
jgi:hypothetical protein